VGNKFVLFFRPQLSVKLPRFAKISKKICSFLCSLSLITNIFLPYFSVFPIYATDTGSFSSQIEYSSPSHKLNITTNSSEIIEYQLFYKTVDKIDSIAGSDLAVTNMSEAFYLGTCSAESICLPQDFSRGVLKLRSATNQVISQHFVFENNIVTIVKEVESLQFDLTNLEEDFLNNIPYLTFEKVELNKEYTAFGVTIVFTKLPQNSGNIKVEEITLTPEQIHETGSLSDKAYDITSNMEDGTFSYNLSLPIPESSVGETVDIKFAEDVSQIDSAQIIKDSITTDTSVSVNLDHFTIFVVVKITDKNLVEKEIFKIGETVYINTVIFDLSKTKIRIRDPSGNIAKTYNETFLPVNQYKHITELSDDIGEYSIDVGSYKRLGFLNWKWVWEDNVDSFTLIEGICGDSIIDSNEICDDGNLLNADGCSDLCTIENGWQCNGSPSICIDITPPAAPFLISPEDNYFTNQTSFLQTWDSSDTDIDHYEYRSCSNNPNLEECHQIYTTTTTAKSRTVNNNNISFWWQVRAIDFAGNKGDWTSAWKITIDNTLPSATIDGIPPKTLYNDDTSISVHAIDDNYLETKLYKNNNVNSFKTYTGSWFGLSWLGEGSYRMAVIDKANNSIEYNFEIDKTAPIIAINPYITNNKTPSLSGTVNDNTASISVQVNGITYTGINDGNGTWGVNISNTLPDGTYNVIASATDSAGNVGNDATSGELIIDTIAPIATYKHYIDNDEFVGSIAYVNNLNKLTFTGEYSDINPSSQLLKDSYVIFDAQADGSFRFSQNGAKAYCGWRKEPNLVHLSGNPFSLTDKEPFSNCISNLTDGEYYIAHQVYDNAVRHDIPSITQFRDIVGLHFIIDTVNPVSQISSPANNGTNSVIYSNSWNGSISGTASDDISGVMGVKVSIQKGSTQYFNGSDFIDSDTEILLDTTYLTGTWVYSSLTSPPADSYTIKSHAIDNAGNTENTYTLTIILDKTIDEVSITLNPIDPDASNGWYKTQPEATLTQTDTNFDRIEYQWDSQTGTWLTYSTPIKPLSEGAHVLYYRAIDKANNISGIGVKNIKWDQTDLEYGPQNISANPNPTSGSTSQIKWDFAKDNTGIDKYEVQWKLNDATNPPSYSKILGAGTSEVEIDQLIEGRWTVKVVAFDGSGRSKDNSIDVVVDRSGPTSPTLNLTGTGAGTATLSWNAITDAKDYIIWYGNAPGSRLYGAKVGNVTSYTVRGLGAGNYYFIVRAVDEAQNQSAESNEVNTGTIAGALNVEPNTPAEGFTPEVLGTDTEEPTPTPTQTASVSDVLGVSVENTPQWYWLWLLLLIPLYLILRRLFKRNQTY
jgi:cysteine-rich repeat protein